MKVLFYASILFLVRFQLSLTAISTTTKPTTKPRNQPTRNPSKCPTLVISTIPPSKYPTLSPSLKPSLQPTFKSTSSAPTVTPSKNPTSTPNNKPPTLKPTTTSPSLNTVSSKLPTVRPSTSPTSTTGTTTTVTALIYADNYFEFYVNGVLVKKDPLDFTPHNAVRFTFTKTAGVTTQYAIKASDFASSSGYEYTNSQTRSAQIGDGALRMVFSDGTVSNTNWKCMTTSYGPTSSSIAAGCSATNLSPCQVSYTAEPTDWTQVSYDDSAWEFATYFTDQAAGWGSAPTYQSGKCMTLTDPYTGLAKSPNYQATTVDECVSPAIQNWGASVFIWRPSLDYDNTILCRMKV